MGVWAVSLCFPRRAGRGRGSVGRSHLGVGKFVVFLPLHSPVLKPDLDLALRQAERVGDLDAAPPGQVAVKVEFLLQFQDLLPGIGGSRALRFASVITGVDLTWREPFFRVLRTCGLDTSGPKIDTLNDQAAHVACKRVKWSPALVRLYVMWYIMLDVNSPKP